VTVPDRRELRRGVGPVAWCALECLLEHSVDGGRTAVASVRAIAAELGVAKNTAHRALAALARAGLVEVVQSRDGAGRFRAGHYRLHVDGLADKPTTQRTKQQRTKQQPKNTIQSQQLTLIPTT
jgi:DNA-binding transcriptional regulator YhcF (GntR family)